MPTEKLKIN